MLMMRYRYKIVPLGSFSRVDELPPSKNTYELYARLGFTGVPRLTMDAA